MSRLAAAALSSLGRGRALAAEAYKAAETFDAVWKIVRDSHFDPNFDVAAWERVSSELRPKAVAAATPGELRAVLRDMLGRLGLSHFAVIPATPDAPTDHADLGGVPGFETRLIGRDLVVSSVDPDGAAAAAGVRPGWIVRSVAGAPITAILAGISDEMPARLAEVEAWRASIMRLRGPYGSTVDVTFDTGAGAVETKSIVRKAEGGVPVTVGSLPTMFVRVSSSMKQTPGGHKAGVIGFNVWMASVGPEFQRAVDQYRGADGIVIDLRGNPGGLAAMVMGIAGHFTPNRDTLGVMKTKALQPPCSTPTRGSVDGQDSASSRSPAAAYPCRCTRQRIGMLRRRMQSIGCAEGVRPDVDGAGTTRASTSSPTATCSSTPGVTL